jgi:hypothetical protein
METQKFPSRDHPEVRGALRQRQIDARRAFLRVGDICANVVAFCIGVMRNAHRLRFLSQIRFDETDFDFAIDARLNHALIDFLVKEFSVVN